MDLTFAIALTKMFKLGYDAWDAYCREGIDSKELDVISDALARLNEAAAGRRARPDVAAQHVGLILAAFGRAFERHWVGTRSLERPSWLKRWLDGDEHARDKDIQARLRMAGLGPRSVGDRAPGTDELADVDALIGHPLSTPYYRELWRVFSDPALTLDGEEPPLDLDGPSRRAFERHFALAYAQAWNGAPGRPVRDYVGSLEEYRVQVIRESLIRDMATWDERHVFGNRARDQWDDDQLVPFLPLGQMYVEPNARRDEGDDRDGRDGRDGRNGRNRKDGEGEEPILGLLGQALEQAPYVTVVKADFGMGKSLTARMLACTLAQRYLDSSTEVSRDLWLPVFVRCADDVLGETPQLEHMVRSALRRHAEDVGISRDLDDQAFALPEGDQRVLIVVDGLDEVVLGQRALEGIFKHLRGKATARRAVVVMTRPGVLPERRELRDVRLLELCRFQARGAGDDTPGGHIGRWLSAWNQALAREQPITVQALDERGLLELAGTPILLFMIAHTWDEHGDRGAISHARLYELFFRQIARGKYERDRADHKPVYDAARKLHDCLRDHDELDSRAEPHEAMLWLLSRLAWKDRQKAWQHRLEARLRGEDSADAEPLTRRDVENVLRDELRLDRDVAETVKVGVVLSLQTDLTAGRDHIHFGHKSFREFLVARYWADRLRKLARGREREWDGHVKKLLGARLLLPEDRGFEFLMQIVAGADEREDSPFAWTEKLRDRVKDWAEDCFNDENQAFPGDREDMCVRDDQRTVLREAALAIGSGISLIDRTRGIEAKTPWVMRSLLAWFWATQEPVRVVAPRARLPGINAAGVAFHEADFREADLQDALLKRAVLVGATFRHANLRGANFGGADLRSADLQGAELTRAFLYDANLAQADLSRAILRDAHLVHDAFRGINLRGANLQGADFQNTRLVGIDLQGMNLSNANFSGASLERANLQRVNLYRANLCGADLSSAHLSGASLRGAFYNKRTRWPQGIDPVAEGAVLREYG